MRGGAKDGIFLGEKKNKTRLYYIFSKRKN